MRQAIVRILLQAMVALLFGALSAGAEDKASALLDPQSPAMNQTAPESFKAKFETSKGDFIVEVHREWAPHGADRFYALVQNGFYDDARFFRVISGFMAQVGINGDPKVATVWRTQAIQDDQVKQSNLRGFVSFAMSGPNTRTSQLFINYGDNSRLDRLGFSPLGRIIAGMDIVDQLYSGYGEGAPQGKGPDQARIQREGNKYLHREFPQLDYVKKAVIID
jgi:peptidyl-prolyl cis-trans isomerase A (cyclophilin A)